MSYLASEQKRFIWSCLLIPTLLLILFVAYPAVDLLRISFYKWDGISQVKEFISWNNYKKVFTSSPDLWLSLRNNGIYLLLHMAMIPVELVISLVLESKMRCSEMVKSVLFLPFIISGVAISYAFSYFFSPVNGAFDAILKVLGQSNLIRSWLSDPKIVNYTLGFVSIWRFSGYHIVLFTAGLKAVPSELLEAAKIDGAGVLSRFWNIQLPSMALVMDFVLFDCLRGTLQHFEIPFVMTQGGPGYASSTFTLYTINTAFKFNDFGMASTMAVIIMIIVMIVYLGEKQITKRLRG